MPILLVYLICIIVKGEPLGSTLVDLLLYTLDYIVRLYTVV